MFVETSDELNHRYAQTFIGAREDGVVVPVYVGRFSKVNPKHSTLEGAKYIARGDSVVQELFSRIVNYEDIVWAAPLLGYVNCRDKIVKWVSRAPEAQPARTRGLLPSLTMYSYWNPDASGFVRLTMRRLFENPAESWDIPSVYNPVYMAADEAWGRIRSNEYVGAAISRNIAMIKTRLSRKPVVFYKDLVAGLYDKSGTIFLLPHAHLLYEEMSLYAPCEKVEAKEVARAPFASVGTAAQPLQYIWAADREAPRFNINPGMFNVAIHNGDEDNEEPNW
jgi:hypothetical protein